MAQSNRSSRGTAAGGGGRTGVSLPSLAIGPARATAEAGAAAMPVGTSGRSGAGRIGPSGSSGITVNGRPMAAARSPRKGATAAAGGVPSNKQTSSAMPHIDTASYGMGYGGTSAGMQMETGSGSRSIGVQPLRQKTLPDLFGNQAGSPPHHRSRRANEPGTTGAVKTLLPSIFTHRATANGPPIVSSHGASTHGANVTMPVLSCHPQYTAVQDSSSSRQPVHRPPGRQHSRDTKVAPSSSTMPQPPPPPPQHSTVGDTELVVDRQQKLLGRFDVAGWSEIGAKQENQDVYDIKQLSKAELYVSVLDGHGPAGGDVAELGTKLLYSFIFNRASEEDGDMSVDHSVGGTSAGRKHALRSACLHAHQSLSEMASPNTHNAGATVTVGILRRNLLTMAWLGDSRSVIGREDRRTGKIRATQLTRDHTCDDMVEAARIRRCGGKVQQYYYCGRFVGPKRIWLKEPGQRTPGLMVSRSIGDEIAHSVGCLADPEMLEIDLTARDKVLIVASDGVWDGLSNQRAVEIAWACATAAEASRAIVDAALESLRRHGLADNVTAVVVYLPGPGTGRRPSLGRAAAGD